MEWDPGGGGRVSSQVETLGRAAIFLLSASAGSLVGWLAVAGHGVVVLSWRWGCSVPSGETGG